jgi:ABC-type branched-subunit amino acid transport system permease subunit
LPLIRLIPPGLVVAVFLVLILSAAFYAALPYRRRAYIPILITTTVGVALGQLWDYLGLPSLRLGQANLLPAVAFALAMQLLTRFVPRRQRLPREPKATPPGSERDSAG